MDKKLQAIRLRLQIACSIYLGASIQRMLISGQTMETLFLVFVIVLIVGLVIWELTIRIRLVKFLIKLLRRLGL